MCCCGRTAELSEIFAKRVNSKGQHDRTKVTIALDNVWARGAHALDSVFDDFILPCKSAENNTKKFAEPAGQQADRMLII